MAIQYVKAACSSCKAILDIHPNVAQFIDDEIICRLCRAKNIEKSHGIPAERSLINGHMGKRSRKSTFNRVKW